MVSMLEYICFIMMYILFAKREVLPDELTFQTCWNLSDTIGPPMWTTQLFYKAPCTTWDVQRKPSMKEVWGRSPNLTHVQLSCFLLFKAQIRFGKNPVVTGRRHPLNPKRSNILRGSPHLVCFLFLRGLEAMYNYRSTRLRGLTNMIIYHLLTGIQ